MAEASHPVTKLESDRFASFYLNWCPAHVKAYAALAPCHEIEQTPRRAGLIILLRGRDCFAHVVVAAKERVIKLF
jgi:hypothetical protein